MAYDAYFSEGTDRTGRYLITCDHATNTVPGFVGPDLGLPPADMERHIAYDIGALGVAQALGMALDSPVIWSNFSRLVIDPNRGADDPTLVMKLYDGSLIPANRHADQKQITERLNHCYYPYHNALADLANTRSDPIIISIHSFTPQLKGRPKRPWHMGLLYAADQRMADPMLSSLRAELGLNVGDNEPYTGYLPGDAIDQHATAHQRPNILIELRNDLIGTEKNQQDWANRLAPHILQAVKTANL